MGVLRQCEEVVEGEAAMARRQSNRRHLQSATTFTVTGVVNKFFTVLINVMIWDKHATPVGLVCLLFTLAGGVLYQQSVTRAAASVSQRESSASKPTDGEKDDSDLKSNEEKSLLGGNLLFKARPIRNEKKRKLQGRTKATRMRYKEA